MGTPVKLLLIGCGGIGQSHQVGFMNHPGEVELLGACDPHGESAEAARERCGGTARCFADHLEALDALEGECEGVVVTLPHHLHFPVVRDCLERGLPVLVEKPVACTLDELRQLQVLEAGGGGFVQVGQMQRFGREENWLRRWLQGPEFGEPQLFNLDIYQNIFPYLRKKRDPWILDRRLAGGGVTISVSIHPLDLLRYWLGQDFVEVFAYAQFRPPFKGGAESSLMASLKMSGGTTGTLNSCMTVARCPYSQRSVLIGEHGTLYQHSERPGAGYYGDYYVSTAGDLPLEETTDPFAGFERVSKRLESAESDPEIVDDHLFANQLVHFARGIRRGKPLRNSLAENFNTLATIDALMRSALSGQPETVVSE